MNFVFISPNFPDSYRHFCINLKKNGVNVLGIGDAVYDELNPDLKAALTEYYRVSSLENYDEVLRACGYFTGRYGKIDYIESNNEYWLELDAALRTDFNVNTGLKSDEIVKYKRKSVMKKYYREAGIPVARSLLITETTTLEDVLGFALAVGYPIVAKPDSGVGANATYKLKNELDVENFMNHHPAADYLCEEYISGAVTTYDGIINSKGQVLFAASHITPESIMDVVNEHIPMWYYVDKEVPADVARAGKAVLKAFNVRSRFFHLEFFRLTEAKPGLGKVGDIVALEVNMRPAGGYTTDMINFSQNADVFRIWADMIAFDENRLAYSGPHHYCVYVGRRDNVPYALDQQQLCDWCGEHGRLFTRLPDALSGAMGNMVNIACYDTMDEVNAYVSKAFELQG